MDGKHRRILTPRIIGIIIVLAGGILAPGLGDWLTANSAAQTYVPRGPIRILDDSQFTAANGVVGGTGTSFDPYRISGWRIETHDDRTAIYVYTEQSHVIIENNLVANSGTGINVWSSWENPIPTVLIRGNVLYDNIGGIGASDMQANISHNTLYQNTVAVGVSGAKHQVWFNEIRDNKVGIGFVRGVMNIHENNIYGNEFWGLISDEYVSPPNSFGLAFAQNNYWGSADGPRHMLFVPGIGQDFGPVGPGSGDFVGPMAITYPWRTTPVVGAGTGSI